MVADEIEGLLAVGNWQRLLFIQEPAIRSLTLEVLDSFEFDRSYRDLASINTIQFRAFGRDHSMSLTQFSIHMGLYDEDYTETEEYENLPADYPGSLTPQRAYHAVCGLGQYEPGVSKATSLS